VTAAARDGHGPERSIQSGVGPVAVRRAKVRDGGNVGAAEKIRFTSSMPPNLSPLLITRRIAEWQADYEASQKRDLSASLRGAMCLCGRTGFSCGADGTHRRPALLAGASGNRPHGANAGLKWWACAGCAMKS
jgi:hypothetical protein